MKVEKVILAKEGKERNPRLLAEVNERLLSGPVEFVSHPNFKARTTFARAAVRTGEFAPYTMSA